MRITVATEAQIAPSSAVDPSGEAFAKARGATRRDGQRNKRAIGGHRQSARLSSALNTSRRNSKVARHEGVYSMRMGPAVLFALALVAAGPAAAQSVKGDAAKGATLFKQRCGFCHSVVLPVAPGPAPNLKGVLGRKAASTDFSYSTALAAANLQWTAPNLDKFLAAPAAMVPGTFMAVAVPKSDERASIISYLAALK